MKSKIKLADKSKCAGCVACADACPIGIIRMDRDEEGFSYPAIDSEKCVSCGKCMSVCPAINDTERHEVQKLYAAWISDASKAKDSSSGGIFQTLAEKTLRDGGYVFGAAFDSAFHLRHVACDSIADLKPLLKSKYLQSDPSGIYKAVVEMAKRNIPVLFSGTPCQCDGLRRYYLANNAKVPDNLLVCELLCHGVCSPGLFDDYVVWLNRKGKNLTEYLFRDKTKCGWKTGKMCVSLKYSDGSVDSHSIEFDLWHTWFGRHISVRPSCFECKYRDVVRVGDITLGDFWSITRIKPELSNNNGVSAVFVNTEKGAEGINSCGDMLNSVEMDKEKMNTMFRVPITKDAVKLPNEREVFFETYRSGGVPKLARKFPAKTAFTLTISKMKSMLKRIVRGSLK